MRAMEVDYIINIKMEMTNLELEKIVEMCQMGLENSFDEDVVEYRELLVRLREVAKRVRAFDNDSSIVLGYF